MIGQTISHYRITRQLGAGGMGVVYEARDLKLDRTVALKFLPPELTDDPEAKARFVHEAKAASTLDHPNVCSIYEIDETDKGQLFIVMACYEGETLKERISRGPLPLGDALGIAQDISAGLAKAHEREIVHRDIKPANIFITKDGLVKILDFGLAKLPKVTKVTRTGSILGTVAYMSPEQARGENTDHRTDLWCLGAVLYETVTGQPPFRGDHEQAVVYSILNEEPQPVTGLRTGVPLELERLIDRCLEKDPRLRYQTAGDLASDLGRVRRSCDSADQPTLALSHETRPRRRWRWLAGLTALAVVVAMLVIYPRLAGHDGTPMERGKPRMVVLPFTNLGDPEDEYFADGITEEITSRLAAIQGLSVISRTSALHFKGSDKTVREIGRELNVGFVLEGTVRWEREPTGGSRIRVTPRLIRATDDSQLWTDSYNEDFAAVFSVQSRIAGRVIEELDVALAGTERERLAARPTDNVVAYQNYLRGIDLIVYPHRLEQAYRRAQQLFEQAIDIDPDFALAYAKLSEAHRDLYFFGYDHTEQRLAMAKEAIDKALELDPDLAEAQRQLGYYYYQGLLDYDRALSQFTEVARILPNDAQLLQDISFIWRRQGRWQDALANQLSAFERSPTDAAICVEIANTYADLRMHDEALVFCDRAIVVAPDLHWGYFLKSLVLVNGWGDVAGARATLEANPDKRAGVHIFLRYYIDLLAGEYASALDALAGYDGDVFLIQSSYLPVSLLRGLTLARLGDEQGATAELTAALVLLEDAVARNPADARIHSALGLTYAGLGRKDEAIAAGRKAVELYPRSRDAMLGVTRLNDLAQIYARTGETALAIETIHDILSHPGSYTLRTYELHPTFAAVRTDPGYESIRREFGQPLQGDHPE